MHTNSPFTDVQTAIEEIRDGRMVVVVDDEDRENEGDLTMAAEMITPEAINFMAKYGRGLICLAMTPERLDSLRLQPMSAQNTARFGTAFTESIDALGRGVTTGISAYDRAETIRCAIDPQACPSDLGRPGHIFPLRAQNGGVLVRAGQTEASVDLTRLAGLTPAGVICEIMNDDGTMARVPDLIDFCKEHELKMITVAELIRHRMAHERYVYRKGEAVLPTEFGEFSMIAYGSDLDGESHVALVYGDLSRSDEPTLVRMHTHCFAGDVFHASSCECASYIRFSLQRIADEGRGALIYLHQNSLGFSFENVDGADKVQFHRAEEDLASPERLRHIQREVGVGAQILLDLNLRRIRLLTNYPRRVAALEGYGIEIVEHSPISAIETHVFDAREEDVLVDANYLSQACGASILR
ncbi:MULTISPECIES: 3,4-dihydroxy-2-butanone-4-phosphate synthase [Acidobacteriaceae]|uniref:3,4-dihydroxy-2-butanone-4-phosphate synthase n=1 Tax=Acidobacteriaceae TaxID=204434 RepID=UPI00131B5111|nr:MULTISPECIES: 3,4-dihydroxy-2-butanone-4-phosphate synthase [Acidobacteriaceae]MDW5265177.1 3,4-dihydroxy-2-butanone-4-phosphate synthase [Edaphobacter sp.]